jgi:hypothetical protein
MKNIATKTDKTSPGAAADYEKLPAAEANSIISELKNTVLATGQTLDENNSQQVAQALTDHALGASYAEDTGTANNYILSITGSRQTPPVLVKGYRLFFQTGNVNTSTTPTLNYAGLGVKTIVAENGTDAIVAGDIKVGAYNEVVYDGTNWCLILSKVNSASETVSGTLKISTTAQVTAGEDDESAITPAKFMEYLNTGRVIFSNNATTPNTQLDYTAGRFAFSSGGSGKVSAGTLNFATNGAGGLDTGSFQGNTTYHIFGITNFTNGTSSIIASLSLIPTLPSGYTKYKRIMSVLSNSTPAIRPFIQDGIKVSLKDSVLSYSGNINSTPTLRSMTIPTGIRVEAWGFCYIANFNVNNLTITIRDPSANNGLGYGVSYGGSAAGGFDMGGNFSVLTNTNSQLYASISGGSTTSFTLYTQGWIDNNI